MKSLRLSVFLGALIGLLLMSSVVGFPASQRPDVINVGYFNHATVRKLGAAKGWYEEATGVKTNWIWTKSGAEVFTMLVAGELDIAGLGSAPAAVAATRKVPFRIISISMNIGRNEALIAGDDIYTPYDLKGKKVAVPFASTTHYCLMRMLSLYDISPKSLEILDMQPMGIGAAFMKGDIDAGWTWDPGYTKMVEAGGHIVMTSEDMALMGYPTWDNIVVRKGFAEKHPDLVVKWLKTYLKTIDYYQKNPDETAKVIAEFIGAKVDTTKRVLRRYGFPEGKAQLSQQWLGTPDNPGTAAHALGDQAKFLYEQDQINTILDDYTKFVDPTFMQKAVESSSED